MKGIVARVTGSWHDIRLEDGTILPSRIIGKLRMDDIKTTNPVGVGDEKCNMKQVMNLKG